MTCVGQCPVCHSQYELEEDDIGHVLECDCGAALFACGLSSLSEIPVVCEACHAEYAADPQDAGEQLDCECGKTVIVPSVLLRQPISADTAHMPLADEDGPNEGVIACPQCGVEYEVAVEDAGETSECECGCEFVVDIDQHGTFVAEPVSPPVATNHPQVISTDEPKREEKREPTGETAPERKPVSWASRIGVGSVAALLLVSIVMFVFREQFAGQTRKPETAPPQVVALSGDLANAVPTADAIAPAMPQADASSETELEPLGMSRRAVGAPADRTATASVDSVAYRVPPPPVYSLPAPREPRTRIAIPVESSSTRTPAYDRVFEAYEETMKLKQAADASKSPEDVKTYHQRLGETIRQLHEFHDYAVVQSDAESNKAEINSVRYLLAYLYFTAGYLPEAAVMGTSVARWGDKEETSTHEGAMIALAAMQEASETHWGNAKRVGELLQMQEIADLLASRWPLDPQLDLIWMNLGFLYEAFNFPDRAAAVYEKVTPTSDQYAAAQIAAGNATWAFARLRAGAEDASIDEAATSRARELLSRGLESLGEDAALPREAVAARLSLAQIELSAGNPAEAQNWLIDGPEPLIDSISVAGGGRDEGVEVSEATARHVFDALFAARQQLGDEKGATEALQLMAIVLGTSPEEIASKTLGVVTRKIRRLESQEVVSGEEVADLVTLSQPLVDGGADLTPANLMWLGEAWMRIGQRCEASALSQQCAAEAADLYRRAIQHGDFPIASLQSARLRRVQLLRDSGDAAGALEMIEQVLAESPNVFALQVEAAETLQQIGIESGDPSQLVSAVEGKGAGSPIWGWGKLVTTLHSARWSESGTESHAELLIRSQYNLAKCRILIAKRSPEQQAPGTIEDVQRMLRTLLSTMDETNQPWYDRLKQLQSELSTSL